MLLLIRIINLIVNRKVVLISYMLKLFFILAINKEKRSYQEVYST